jgi:hypothetical protein
MPFTYSDRDLQIPGPEPLKGKDLGITLDIGGKTKEQLSPQDEMAKKFGVAIQDTMQAGVNIATKLPLVEPAAKFIADSPIGWLGGKAMDLLNVPSWLVQQGAARFRLAVTDKNSLPQDVRNMLASGASIDDVADYMYNSGRAFSNDQAANLFWQVILDPLNFTPLALAKVNLLKTAGKAGAILGGAALGGPVGAIAGGVAAWKGAGIAKKVGGLIDKAPAGPTLRELGAPGGELTTLEKITQKLSTPVGADLGTRVPAGARNLAKLDEIDAELTTRKAELAEKGSDSIIAGRISELEASRRSTVKAMEIGKDVTNGFAVGVYRGLVGSKNSMGNGFRAISAAMGVPVAQTVPLKLGGKDFNDVVDGVAESMPAEVRAIVPEIFGRGASNIAVIATTRMLAAPEISLSNSIANATWTIFNQANENLRVASSKGADVVRTSDELAQEMLRIAQDPASNLGGTNRALRIADNPEGTAELVRRVDTIRNSAGEVRGGATVSQPVIENLSLHVQNELVTSKLTSMGTSTDVAKKSVELLRDMGPQEVARLVSDEIDKLVYEMIPTMRSRDTAYQAFKDRMYSIRAGLTDGTTAGLDSKLFDAQIRNQFDKIFSKYYDNAGKIASERANLEGAAKSMVALDMASFATSNKAAARVNETFRMFATTDPAKISELVAKHGQETYDQMRAIADRFTGTSGAGIMLVRQGYLFGASANALVDVYNAIKEVNAEARAGVSSSAEVRHVTGQAMMHEYAGTVKDVAKIVKKIEVLAQKASHTGDIRTRDLLTNLRNQVKNAKNLDEARQAWKKVSLDASKDMKSVFGDASDANEIVRYLQRAIDDGFAATDLSQSERSALVKFIKGAGLDPNLIKMFTGDGGKSAYVAIRAPKSPYHRVTSHLRNPNIDDPTKAFIYQSKVTPFIDMTAPILDEVGGLAPRYTANKMQEIFTGLFTPIGTRQVTANIKNRLASYMARGGITSGHLSAIMDEVVKRAMEEGVSARGLARNRIEDAFRVAFDDYAGPGSYSMFRRSWTENLAIAGSAEFDPVKAIMFAFEGNASTVGLTQKATGRMKSAMPFLARITDNYYPNLRFKMNPIYWLQEWVESPILNEARGINKNTLSVLTQEGKSISVSADQVRDLSAVGPEAQSIIDNVSFLTVFRNDALQRALDSGWNAKGWKDKLKDAGSGRMGNKLVVAKDAAKDRAAMNLAAQNFYKQLAERDPRMLNALIVNYGTNDSTELFVRYVDMRNRLRNTERVLTDIEASRPASMGFRRIPDKNLEAMDEFKFNTLGGMNVGSEIQTSEEIFSRYIASPYDSALDLSVQADRMRDAGYDMSLIEPAIAEVKAALYNVDDIRKGNARAFLDDMPPTEAEAQAIAKLSSARKNLKTGVERLERYYDDAVMRRVAAETMMLDTALATGGQLSYEAGIMAQSLALGHSYSSEIADVTASLQRIVEEAKITLADEFGPGVRLTARNPQQRARLFEIVRERAKQASSNPDSMNALTNASFELLTKHGAEERIYRAFEHVYETSLKEANKITYFNPERTFFERTVNHPFLGFYPYSYMYKKILPEMINFLFKKPFGYQAPGAGFQAYMHVRDYFENQMETDYTFRKFMEDNDEVAFLITQMFPGVPWDISAMPPSYVRAVAASVGGKDKDYTMEDFLARDVFGSVTKLGPLGSIPSTLGAAQQIINNVGGGNQPKLDEYVPRDEKDYFDID